MELLSTSRTPSPEAPFWRVQLEKIRRVIRRKKESNRDNSPGPPLPIIFTAGKMSHPHTKVGEHEQPSKYILLQVSQSGSILPIDDDNPYILGYLICECLPSDQYRQVEKSIVFIPTSVSPGIPDPGSKAHFVQSLICLPDLSFVQSQSNKSWPLFYRLPLEMQQLQKVKELNKEQILASVHRHLSDLAENIDNDEVDTVYQALFDTLVEYNKPVPMTSPHSSSSSFSSLPPTPLSESSPPAWRGRQERRPAKTGLDGGLGAVRRRQTTPPPPPHTSASWKFNAPHGVAIYKFPSLDAWHSICGDKLGRVQKKKIKEALNSENIKKPSFGVLIYPNREGTQLDFFLLTVTAFDALEDQSVKGKTQLSCTYKNITYSLVHKNKIVESLSHRSDNIFQNPVKFLSLDRDVSFDWFQTIVAAIAQGTLIVTCTMCKFECLQTSQLDQHMAASHPYGIRHRRKGGHSMKFSSGSSSSSSDEESQPLRSSHKERGSYKDRTTGSILANNIAVYTPKILEEVDCPQSYIRFWRMRAVERRPTNDGKHQSRWVAPHYPLTLLSMETHVNFPGLLETEFVNYAKAYQSYLTQVNWASVEGNSFASLEVFNDAAQLTILGKGRILDDLKKQAPSLENKSLTSLTEATVNSFFSQSRFYALSSSIPHDSWSDFFLTNAALGPEILSRVRETLAGFPTYKAILKNFSSFIERILITLLPVQESYADTESRMLEAHRSQLLGPNANIDYTRTKLMADSRELVSKSPYFKQVQTTISDQEKRFLIEGCKTNLLFKVISNTVFEAKLHKLLIASDKFSQLDEIPYNVLLDHIQSLITADKKSEVAYVNATKEKASSRFSKQVPSTTSPVKKGSPSPPSSPRAPRSSSRRRQNSGRLSPTTSPSRRSSSSKNVQDRCDICKQMRYPDYFCAAGHHCRISHHQKPVKNPIDFHKKVEAREPNLFVTFEKCPICRGGPPTSSNWIQSGNSSSSVQIPRDFFNQPFTLHPQTVADLAQQLSRMPPPIVNPNQGPHSQRHWPQAPR